MQSKIRNDINNKIINSDKIINSIMKTSESVKE